MWRQIERKCQNPNEHRDKASKNTTQREKMGRFREKRCKKPNKPTMKMCRLKDKVLKIKQTQKKKLHIFRESVKK